MYNRVTTVVRQIRQMLFFTCFIPAIGGVGVLASSPPVNMNMNVNVNMNMNMYMNVNVNVYTVSRCTM